MQTLSVSRRHLLLLAPALILTGCATEPSLLQSFERDFSGLTPADFAPDDHDIPNFYPAFGTVESKTLQADFEVRFSNEAVADGAPAYIPQLRAVITFRPDSLSCHLFRGKIGVWQLQGTVAGFRESRLPLLDKRIAPRPFLRDLAFIYFPEKVLRHQLEATGTPDHWKLLVGQISRTLSVNGKVLLSWTETEDKKTGTIEGRYRNYAEGYEILTTMKR